MRRARRKGANKEKVFGCDLQEHLAASSQEIPHVLRICSEFLEEHGVVDGIYRLSGVSSNIQKLRSEFDNEASPDLHKELYLQDIHCVSSLCKAYFRELPNPLLTYNLYDKFAEAVAIQLEEERLVKIRDVLKELPALHYRTLEFLMCHLVKMASHSSETNMHSRNLAIVWAPNLLRSKDIENSGFNGTAAFMEVRVQSIVVEFILTHVPQLFSEKGVLKDRRTSLPSTAATCGPEEPIIRDLPPNMAHYGNISPGDGPIAMRPYHAIIEGTDKRKGSLKGRKWMSIFNIGGRFHEPWRRSKNSQKDKVRSSLRPARSMDSLSIQMHTNEGSRHPVQHASAMSGSGAIPSPQASTEAGPPAGATGGSGYAVTYRRGTGVLSGGAGTQGMYNSLDPEGIGGGAASGDGPLGNPSRSPGQSSAKLGRRAAMHISGPHMVTVPLHITSSLALGVLQGGGGDRVVHCGRDRDGGERAEGKARGGRKVEPKDEKKREVDGRKKKKQGGGGGGGGGGEEVVEGGGGGGEGGEEVKEEGGGAGGGAGGAGGGGGGDDIGEGGGGGETVDTTETLVEDKKDEQNHLEEDGESKEKPDVQSSEEEEGESEEMSEDEGVMDDDQVKPVEKVGGQVPDGEQGDEIVNSDLHQYVTEDTEDEYMDMKGDGLPNADAQVYCRSEMMENRDHRSSELPSVLDVTGLEGDDHELSGYVQESFDFLDHIDCSVSNQVNEFSVEPPGYEDDEYEEMEAHGLVLSSSPRASRETQPSPHHLHRHSEPNPGLHLPNQHHPPLQRLPDRRMKSLSLPYISTYACPLESSSEDEGDDCNADDEDDDGCSEEDGDDNEDEGMFYKSLPSNYAFHNMTWTRPDSPNPSPPPADQFVDLLIDEESGHPSQSSEAAALEAMVIVGLPGNGKTRNMENEYAVKSQAVEEREGQNECCEEDEAQTKRVETGDLHLVVHTSQAADGSNPSSLISEPAEAWECSLQTKVLTGTEATAEVRVEGDDISHRGVENSGSGSLEVTTPPSSQIETCAEPEGILDASTEFCDQLPDPPSDLCVWEDEGMDSVEGEWNQVGQETNDVGEEIFAQTPIGEPERVPGYKRAVQGPKADVCTLAHKGEDVPFEIVQRQTEPSWFRQSPVGSSEEIEIIPREGEEQSGEGETDIQVMELLDVHVLEERMREQTKEKMVQKDEAGITGTPTEGSGEVFDEQASKDKRKREDVEPIESDPTEESVPNDQHDRGDGKNQDEKEKLSVCGECKMIQPFGETEAPEKERKDAGSTREHSQPLVSMDRIAKRTDVSQRDMAESKPDTLKEGLEGNSGVGSEIGVGRKLVISHQSPSVVYQVRSVPVVPPKPQHCRLTALNLRQQQQQQQQQQHQQQPQQQQQRSEGRVPDREREWKKETPLEDIYVGEVEAVADGVDEKQEEAKQRKGLAVAERQRRSRDWEDITAKDTSAKNNPHSMCFDEAVAKATMRRERERESSDRERQKDWGYE